ncbi:dihydroneopterin aldolase [Psychrobacter sp. AOP22-C1-22]|uniref:dihydroneopterin aldolase n=1 Tax=unclassified Psychrobacter TaxID=196806 RepID=UPI00178875DB|nr:dihydroneopterin aldolase [Psychrobacter sp. FME6]MBE0406467.1 dihydroneopterin aldolase [Psychrobacter sp. FME6]MDN5891892.1 dihydroneopterin aldolase [Psychrobacter sp.]
MFHTQSDVVFVKGLKVEAVIGVYEWERAITQPLLIDIALETDIRKAAISDDVGDALNYKAVCDDVTDWCQTIKAQLLEHLAGEIVDKLLAKYACHQVTLSVAKPTAIKQADAVGVQITRSAKASDSEAVGDNNSQSDDA